MCVCFACTLFSPVRKSYSFRTMLVKSGLEKESFEIDSRFHFLKYANKKKKTKPSPFIGRVCNSIEFVIAILKNNSHSPSKVVTKKWDDMTQISFFHSIDSMGKNKKKTTFLSDYNVLCSFVDSLLRFNRRVSNTIGKNWKMFL